MNKTDIDRKFVIHIPGRDTLIVQFQYDGDAIALGKRLNASFVTDFVGNPIWRQLDKIQRSGNPEWDSEHITSKG